MESRVETANESYYCKNSAQLNLPCGLSAIIPQNPGWNMTFSTMPQKVQPIRIHDSCIFVAWYKLSYAALSRGMP